MVGLPADLKIAGHFLPDFRVTTHTTRPITEMKKKAIKKNPPPFIQPDPFPYQSIIFCSLGRLAPTSLTILKKQFKWKALSETNDVSADKVRPVMSHDSAYKYVTYP